MIIVDVLDSTVDVTDGVTIANVAVSVGGETYVTAGSSRCNPIDAPDDVIGSKLALARALRKMARELQADAYADVQVADEHRRSQAAARRRQLRRKADQRRRDAERYAVERAASAARRSGSVAPLEVNYQIDGLDRSLTYTLGSLGR